MNPTMLSWREATDADLGLLAEWNHQLIRDEGHRNPMTVPELSARMQGWLRGEYRALIFIADEPVAYGLFRQEKELVYLRQFFVRRDRRREGVGRAALEILRHDIWPKDIRLTVDVLSQNHAAISFYRNAGFQDYALTLEIMPKP